MCNPANDLCVRINYKKRKWEEERDSNFLIMQAKVWNFDIFAAEEMQTECCDNVLL